MAVVRHQRQEAGCTEERLPQLVPLGMLSGLCWAGSYATGSMGSGAQRDLVGRPAPGACRQATDLH